MIQKNLYQISLCGRQISGTLVILILARYIPVYEYGLFSSYRTIATLLLILTNAGFNEYILVSSKNILKEIRLKIGIFLLNALLIITLIILFSLFLKLTSNILFILVLIRTFLDSVFFLLVLPYFQASKNFKAISFVNIFYSIIVICIALYSYINKVSLTHFLLLNIILGIWNFIQVSFYTKINYLVCIKFLKSIIRKIDSSILSYISVFIYSYLYGQIPALYISLFVPKKAAALYFAALTISLIINLLTVAQIQKTISDLINVTSLTADTIIKENLKLIMGINISILIFFIILGKWLLKQIYSQVYYIEAYPILLILTFANISIALASIYGAYITATGNQHMKIRMQIEAIFITIISLFILHKLGIYAAALSYFLSATHIGYRYFTICKQLLRQD